MSKDKDLRINEYAIDVRNLKAGDWVVIRWNDSPDDVALLLEVEERQKTYKGSRQLRIMYQGKKGKWTMNDRADSGQVVRVLGHADDMSYREAYNTFVAWPLK